MLSCSCSAVQQLFNLGAVSLSSHRVVVRLRVGQAGKATALPPPLQSLFSSPRQERTHPLHSSSSIASLSPPRRRFLLLLLPRITPSTLLSAAEVSALLSLSSVHFRPERERELQLVVPRSGFVSFARAPFPLLWFRFRIGASAGLRF